MKRNLILQFVKRFKKIEKLENQELKKMSMREKFQKLSSLLSMAIGVGISFGQEKETQMFKSNWSLLKSKF